MNSFLANGSGFAIVMAVAILCMILFGVALLRKSQAASAPVQTSSDPTIVKKTIFAICAVYGMQVLLMLVATLLIGIVALVLGINGDGVRAFESQYPFITYGLNLVIFVLSSWITAWYAGRRGWLRPIEPARVVTGIVLIFLVVSAVSTRHPTVVTFITQVLNICILYYFLQWAKKRSL
jgi:hypothetical protein